MAPREQQPADGQARARKPTHNPERGSGAVSAIGIVCSLLLLGLMCAGLAGLVTANHRAATAADLAALAAADAARGIANGDPCTRAADLAAAHGAKLIGCAQPSGLSGTVDVRTSVPVHGPLAFLGPAEGISRAGPPSPPPPTG
ncbi:MULTISPECIES: Rv3654c family TadE-like protein [Rothia]|uniref:Rv3654c family TadE-like protein n=1 Tax=Rothia TaxID=32207 RepID=UPI0009F1C8D3|nr:MULTISPECIES: Rv3654c family TadE-like protein [Rothia]